MVKHPLILFDGICNLCNKTVDFIISHDQKKQFRFVALQSDAGKKVIEKYAISPETDSVILILNNEIFFESEAAMEIARFLSFPWKSVLFFKVIPKNWRDKIYRWIAKNRYRWFGKKNSCRIPTPKEKMYFPEINDLDF